MTGGSSPIPLARVLVTGCAGFIGLHTALRLLGEGVEILGIDNLNGYYDPALKQARLAQLRPFPGFRFEEADVADHEAIARLVSGFRPDAVVHLAAQAGVRYSLTHPRAYVASNLDGFLGVLEACRHVGVRHLVYASSSSVYGANRSVPFREGDAVDHPVSLYAATKRSNELMAETYSHLFAIPASGLRFFTVYGPWGRPDMAYWTFTRAILAGEPIPLFNEGRMLRDFTFIDDVAQAVCDLARRPPGDRAAEPVRRAGHEIYNVGNHTPVELRRFVRAIETATGCGARTDLLPMQEGDVPATYADTAKLAAVTGFAPRTAIEDGIARFVEWYRGYHR